jgi:hypothetical protein
MVAVVAILAWAPVSEARVTRIIIDRTAALTGQDIPYETLTGRAFGELMSLVDEVNAEMAGFTRAMPVNQFREIH